ncbi:hypothetical protein AVEN_73638-1 [Araneus ventricosus]|uniref:CCHC-type domain-containing protein n=1 Tax=Araneus ventricosus TaxID=182803 RepID=A0A4Y2Q514_ARAVE|nr:hypothetical protein AVEN_73638-1 [Araneus ventricosus]
MVGGAVGPEFPPLSYGQKKPCPLQWATNCITFFHFYKFSNFFLVNRSSTSNENFHTVSPFLVEKAIIATVGEVKSTKKLRSGDLLVEVHSRKQSQQIVRLTHFSTIPITVSQHASLNSSKGVITCGELLNVPTEEILKELQGQGVSNVRRISIRRDGQLLNIKHLILIFDSAKLPENIKAGYMRLSVRAYIPNPLRCFKCQRFGHSKTSCRETLTCARCAEVEHESTDCTRTEKCVNYPINQTGDLLVEVHSRKQSEQIVKLKTFSNIPITVSPQASLNSSKGVITCGDLFNDTTEAARSGGEPCTAYINTERWPAPTYKAPNTNFDSAKLPEHIKAGYMCLSVRTYIPNPLRCFKCQRFGHSKTSCRETLTCARCAEVGHESTDCTRAEKCVNSKQEHTSFSRNCSAWKREKEIISTKIKKQISYQEARKLVTSQTPIPGNSYVSVAKKSFSAPSVQKNPDISTSHSKLPDSTHISTHIYHQSALKPFATPKPTSVDTELLPMAVLPPLEKILLQSRESDADAEMSSSSFSEEDALEYNMSEELGRPTCSCQSFTLFQT